MISAFVGRLLAFLTGRRKVTDGFGWRVFWAWYVDRTYRRVQDPEHADLIIRHVLAGYLDSPPIDRLLPTAQCEGHVHSDGVQDDHREDRG
jgi:hypothetical protein